MTALPGVFFSAPERLLSYGTRLQPAAQLARLLPDGPHSTWRPDPAWGPVPEGWQLWVEEPEPEPIQVEEATIEPLIPKEPLLRQLPLRRL